MGEENATRIQKLSGGIFKDRKGDLDQYGGGLIVETPSVHIGAYNLCINHIHSLMLFFAEIKCVDSSFDCESLCTKRPVSFDSPCVRILAPFSHMKCHGAHE